LLATLYYGAFGDKNPALALLGRRGGFASISGFPFEWLGAIALAILFLMAATSHDFWLKNLTPRVWKSLHMLVYAAFALLVLHVVLGELQAERSPVYPILLGAGVAIVGGLHVAAGLRELRRGDACRVSGAEWIDVGAVDDIPPDRARRVCLPSGDRVAVFRHAGGVSAISDVCAHQGGPLSEGKVVDGCVTCPWHGYQYLPESGTSPPPFTEKLATYEVRAEGRRILLNPAALEPGTPTAPARLEESA
jgi:nitrite reductase/ring-hydroxylating ferredoxin subunit